MSCEGESDFCKFVVELIKIQRDFCEKVEQDIRQKKDTRNGGGAAVGLGGILIGAGLTVASGPVGWAIGAGLLLVGAGGGASIVSQTDINKLRRKCAASKNKMADYLDVARANCEDDDCIPNIDLSDYCNL